MTDFYQEIGQLLHQAVPADYRKALLYAEVEDGMISASLFSEAAEGYVLYLESPDELFDTAYAFWEAWGKENPAWRTLSFSIEEGRFSVDLKYPDQIDENEAELDRRPRVLREHFGEKEVIYG